MEQTTDNSSLLETLYADSDCIMDMVGTVRCVIDGEVKNIPVVIKHAIKTAGIWAEILPGSKLAQYGKVPTETMVGLLGDASASSRCTYQDNGEQKRTPGSVEYGFELQFNDDARYGAWGCDLYYLDPSCGNPSEAHLWEEVAAQPESRADTAQEAVNRALLSLQATKVGLQGNGEVTIENNGFSLTIFQCEENDE